MLGYSVGDVIYDDSMGRHLQVVAGGGSTVTMERYQPPLGNPVDRPRGMSLDEAVAIIEARMSPEAIKQMDEDAIAVCEALVRTDTTQMEELNE